MEFFCKLNFFCYICPKIKSLLMKDLLLTKNFSLSEFVKTSQKVSNKLPLCYYDNVSFVACKLQLLRDYLDKPLIIESGYRSAVLNSIVGGSPTSLHLVGLAVDVKLPVLNYCEKPAVYRYILDELQPLEMSFNSTNVVHLSWSTPSNINL